MALEKITEAQMNANGVVAAPDILSGTAAENKAIFDRMVRNLVAPAYNACVEVVNDLTDTNAGIKKNEEERQAAEKERKDAEEKRQNLESGYVARAETAAKEAEKAAGEAETSQNAAKASENAAADSARRAQAEAERATIPAVAGVYNVILQDRVTGEKYALIVEAEKLKLLGVSNTLDAVNVSLIDTVTGTAYAVVVNGGRLFIEEV